MQTLVFVQKSDDLHRKLGGDLLGDLAPKRVVAAQGVERISFANAKPATPGVSSTVARIQEAFPQVRAALHTVS